MSHDADRFSAGPDFYDEKEVFDNYIKRRYLKSESPNDTMEMPVVLELTGLLKGKRILDLGCGNGDIAEGTKHLGFKSYHGVDGSFNMIDMAKRTVAGDNISFECNNIETWTFPENQYDIIWARLVLHYLESVDELFHSIARALKPSGKFIFSAEHPVITSSEKRWQGKGKRQDWLVDNYFLSGKRENHWMGGQVIKYHRTIEQYFRSLQKVGLTIQDLREAEPLRERFETQETFERRQRIPLFLIMSAVKQ